MFGRKVQVTLVKDEKPVDTEPQSSIIDEMFEDPTTKILVSSLIMTAATGVMALALTTAAAKLVKA